MGVIKEGINHICKRLDDIRDLLRMIDQKEERQANEAMMIRREIEALNDFGEMLEEQKEKQQDQQLLRVMPAENAGKEALFVVTGDELANLLEACSGATVRMKKKESDKK